MYIIGFSGKIGSGKTTLAKALSKKLNELGLESKVYSFATQVKEDVTNMIKNGVNEELADDKKLIELLEDINPMLDGYNKNPEVRKLLQYYGTDIRRAQDANYWINRLENSLNDEDVVIIDDVRFDNEAQFISKEGKVFNLNVSKEKLLERIKDRDSIVPDEKTLNHESEKGISIGIQIEEGSIEEQIEFILKEIEEILPKPMRVKDLIEFLKGKEEEIIYFSQDFKWVDIDDYNHMYLPRGRFFNTFIVVGDTLIFIGEQNAKMG